MKLSEQSLRNWIDTKLTIQDICQQLTDFGLEVEESKAYINTFEKVIIGQITSYSNYSNTGFIVYKVNIGIKNINVICHKVYIKENIKVFIAHNGTKLFNNHVVQALHVHGVVSDGIFCTFHDLGLMKNKNQIVQLPDSAPIGLYIKNYNFYKDKIIKINTTFNRTDVFGSFGIARDLAILNNLPLPKIMNVKIPVLNKNTCNICIEHHNMIYKYCGRVIKNINLHVKTPIWIKEKLIKCQISPVNIVVDIINYVFMELGQSVYAFTFSDDIYNICVGFLKKNILLKDNKNICLNSKSMVLKHKDKILSFLGNIDFNYFPVNLSNQHLFVGSFFIDLDILNYSTHYIQLNNQMKFNEYFVDPDSQKNVIEYTTYLFLKICGGDSSTICSIQSKKYDQYVYRKIKLSYHHVIKMIGHNISYNMIEKILIQLRYHVISKGYVWYITPPSWRPDLMIEEDIISEILKIYHQNNILSLPLLSKHTVFKTNRLINYLKRVKYNLIDRGYYEIITYSFIDPKIQKLINPGKKYLSVQNPISQDMSCMRLSLWPGLLTILLYHQNRQHEEVRFFESGLCYLPSENNILGVDQNLYFSGIIGNIGAKKKWNIPAKKFDFYDIKGDIESIFDVIGCLDKITFCKEKINGLHPNNSTVIIFNKEIIGYMGEIDPFLSKKMNLIYSTFLFELFWYKLKFQHDIQITAVSEFPYIRRDISIIVYNTILVSDIILTLKQTCLSDLIKIQVADVYTGDAITSGYKSITFKLLFQSTYTTLTDNYVDSMISASMTVLQNKFNAILRR
ncbi:phenylalanine--tRNA ligase subunit beta [Buchnera aphidicola]|uniref:Phenylalanine--tRNA ligase beta subunit n=1 Tax=Buchnera aphidicola (Sarucallis kahawaluokalani) TaxID=1241878 RepID=A0A4D6YLR1_9GAMM|nr:phenylalanine--tRNA ligase subunit beta [Buchnera aphidicola]QCI25895.1 phenylalanine--tRNA ligase subunit beta [Buchnera aphidicola (Sarucallis kahawaluokalani)]